MEQQMKHHIIQSEDCGDISVFIQGDTERLREGVTFLTVHDVGATYQTWTDFCSHPSMEEIRRRSVFLHVAVTGQEPEAADLPAAFTFPTMAQLGMGLATVLDHFKVKMAVGLGDGAGANIVLRLAMSHSPRVHGVIAVNPSSQRAAATIMAKMKESLGAQESAGGLNQKNSARFCESYKKRSEILTELPRIKCDVLLVAGTKSRNLLDAEALHRGISAGLCSIIKVEQVAEPLLETPEKTAEALLLFVQGLGLLPTVGRRPSRQDSQGEERRSSMSMEDYDTPNIRRLSLVNGGKEVPEEEEELASPKSMADFDRPNIRRLSLTTA